MKKIIAIAFVAMFVSVSQTSAQSGLFGKFLGGKSSTTTATTEKEADQSAQSGLSNLVGKLTGTSSGTAETITNVLGSLLGNSMTLSENMLEGTWNYVGTSCVLESDEALSNIGGTLVTSKVEEKLDTYLAKVGVKEGSCSFTFIGTDSCKFSIAGRDIKGHYTLDAKEKKINFSFYYGRLSMTSYVTYDLTSLNIVFNADKLLSLVQKVMGTVADNSDKYAGALSSSSATAGATTATIGTITSLLNNYNGMMLGMKLKR